MITKFISDQYLGTWTGHPVVSSKDQTIMTEEETVEIIMFRDGFRPLKVLMPYAVLMETLKAVHEEVHPEEKIQLNHGCILSVLGFAHPVKIIKELGTQTYHGYILLDEGYVMLPLANRVDAYGKIPSTLLVYLCHKAYSAYLSNK